MRDLGIAADVCYPLMCNGRLFGTLSLGRKKGGGFEEQGDLEVMKAVADMAAVALDRASRARELLEIDRCRKKFLCVLAHELRAARADRRSRGTSAPGSRRCPAGGPGARRRSSSTRRVR